MSSEPARRSPAVFASVGHYSGVPGTVLVPYLQGAQLWVKHINQNGGLNGHAVRLLVYDDGADPGRHRAQVQEAVEKEGVIAFLSNAEPIVGENAVDYLNTKRVPVVGMSSGENHAASSPMYFPQQSTGDGLYQAFPPSVAGQMIPKGKTKLGTLVCAEADSCTRVDRAWGESAEKLGFHYVYRGKASLAQPDFTAECLAARNAGAEVLFISLDQNSITRVAASCARQAYHPVVAIVGPAVVDRFKNDPNLDGLIATSVVFPYFQTGSPAADEFQEAMRTLGSGVPAGVGPAAGWVAGKLMQKAAARLPEPPTSAAILAGLWSIKNDTLGNLTMPLTFVTDQPTKAVSCWFDLTIRNKSWASPDGYELHCK